MVRPQSTARSMRTALHRCQVSLHPRARSRKDFLRGRVIFSAWPHAPQVVNQSRRNRCPTFLPHSAAVRLSLQVSYKISQLTAVSRGRYIFGRSLHFSCSSPSVVLPRSAVSSQPFVLRYDPSAVASLRTRAANRLYPELAHNALVPRRIEHHAGIVRTIPESSAAQFCFASPVVLISVE
jgi:hypothetical protein